MTLTINVVGTPAPQGSKKGFYNARIGRVQMVESSKKVKPWRTDVQAAVEALRTGPEAPYVRGLDQLPLDGPLQVEITFYLARPQAHYGRRGDQPYLKDTAPAFVDKKPDGDKLARSTLDGLKEAGLYRDDAQVADLRAVKRYADAATGARITITPLTETSRAATSTPPPGQELPDAPTHGEGRVRPAATPEAALW